MASEFDLTSEEGLEAFRTACEVPRDVIIGPYEEGMDRPVGSVIISSYMLREVGLRFPIPKDLCYLLDGLRMTLECCRPNVLQLLLGVALANHRLNIFLGDRELLANYSFGMNNEELYFQVSPSGRNLIAEIERMQNRNWRQFPMVVVSGSCCQKGKSSQ